MLAEVGCILSLFDESSIPGWNAIDEFPIPPISVVELYEEFGAESDLCSPPLRLNLCPRACLRTRYIDLSIYLRFARCNCSLSLLPPSTIHIFCPVKFHAIRSKEIACVFRSKCAVRFRKSSALIRKKKNLFLQRRI